jgi:hypothetical protein
VAVLTLVPWIAKQKLGFIPLLLISPRRQGKWSNCWILVFNAFKLCHAVKEETNLQLFLGKAKICQLFKNKLCKLSYLILNYLVFHEDS